MIDGKVKRFILIAILSYAVPGIAGPPYTNADLSLASHSTEPAIAGQPITVTVVVTNLGPDYVAGVEVQNQFPATATVLSAEVAHSDGREFPGSCGIGTVGSLDGSVGCGVGSIASQASATMTIVFVTHAGPAQVRSWTFAGLNHEIDISNNTVELLIDVASTEVPAASPLMLALLVVVLGVLAWKRL